MGQVSLDQAVDAFFVLALVPAMRLGATLVMPAPVSRDLLRGAETFQDIYQQWYPGLVTPATVDVTARAKTSPMPPGRGLASCFTGGVDAFFFALHPPRELTRLVYVHGFDVPLRAKRFRRVVSKRLRVAARDLGIPLLEVETNLRELTDPHTRWPKQMHGSALASVGILLAADIDGLLIPSSGGSEFIWADNGSHQLTDRLQGTEYFSVIHHGTGTSRIAKTETVARSRVGARHLRVCFRSREAYNCGNCFKCRRTLLDLHAVRLEHRVKSFEVTPSRRELVNSIFIDPKNPLLLARASRDHIREHGGPRDIERAFTRAIDAHAIEQAADVVLPLLENDGENSEALGTLKQLRSALNEHHRTQRRQVLRGRVRRVLGRRGDPVP